ncbi:dynein light chain 1, cytoplasmic-like [Eublepharis macularius]|uniref:Dynein light chain n=1 Tax=Eublepharis macularius TaxID=481883 RepID=A0AA97KR17_EUBMA|nr:dynein light chain 1, cytoplasmic-like [Eublepharis macularius]
MVMSLQEVTTLCSPGMRMPCVFLGRLPVVGDLWTAPNLLFIANYWQASSSLCDGGAGGAQSCQPAHPLHQHPFPPSSEAAQQHTATVSDRKAVINNADMSEEMQQDSVERAAQALEKYNIEKDIAAHIKKEFDKKYNPTWHRIVARNFGSCVTQGNKHFIYVYLGQVAILLFKSG